MAGAINGITLYAVQERFISDARKVIGCGEVGIFSSPTGTGKTISLLCSVSEHFGQAERSDLSCLSGENLSMYTELFGGPERGVKLLYCSRTHAQLQQAIHELDKLGLRVNATVLGSRKKLCINGNVNVAGVEPSVLDNRCLEAIASGQCAYYTNTAGSNLSGIVDIEDLTTRGSREEMCPYFLAKEYAERCEAVFLPYFHVFTKAGRLSSGVAVDDSTILVVDEAHNVCDALIDINTIEVSARAIRGYSKAFNLYSGRYGSRMNAARLQGFNLLRAAVDKLDRFFGEALIRKGRDGCGARGGVVSVPKFLLMVGLEDSNFLGLDEYVRESKIARHMESVGINLNLQLYNIVDFVIHLTKSDENARIFYDESKVKFFPIDPALYFRDVLGCKAILLAGGTMEPIDYTLRMIGERSCKYFSYGSVSDNFLACVLPSGRSGRRLLINFENRAMLIHEVCESISLLLGTVRVGGVVCFVQSIECLNLIRRSGFDFGRSTFYDDPSFFDADMVNGSAVMFSVMGGRFSEGVNFSNESCRLLIVVGVPFPSATPEMAEKTKYYGREYPLSVAMRTVNQALGRAIRHAADFSAMILMDCRYSEPRLFNSITPWIKNRLKKLDLRGAVREIDKFLRENGV